MLKKIEKKLNLKKKEFTKYFFLSMSLLFLFYFILTISFKEYSILLRDFKEFYFVGFVSSGFLGYLLSKLEFDFIRMYRIMMVFIVIIIVYLCLIHCHLSYTVYSYYLPISIFILIITRKWIALLFGIIFLILCYYTRFLAVRFDFSAPMNITQELKPMLLIIEIITILISMYFSVFLLYYYKKFNEIEKQYNEIKGNNIIFQTKENILNKKKVSDSKFDELYIEILSFLEKSKSFCDPNFSKSTLAKSLNTNESYISKAIATSDNKNFNGLINYYRINQVIEDINSEVYKKHRLKHIYERAGFTQQSTFNRIFREYIGVTPSEYIDFLENNQD